MPAPVFESLHKGLIVSCQALPDEPLYSSFIMGRMALAAQMAGAVGIRANTVADIQEIQNTVSLPIIGIIKQVYSDSDVYITPTEKEVDALVATGVSIIAMDATNRLRTGNRTLEEIFSNVRKQYPDQIFMADCSTFEEAQEAVRLGFDCVGTTMVSYTPYTAGTEIPCLSLIGKLAASLPVPVIAEGGIHTPEQLRSVLDAGAYCAVVGGAITRPLEIARRFIAAIK